jgi:hypothetical protein
VRGDRKWPLNDGQIPNVRGVRVPVSTRYTPVEGNRRASRNGRASSSPARNPSRSDSPTFPLFCVVAARRTMHAMAERGLAAPNATLSRSARRSQSGGEAASVRLVTSPMSSSSSAADHGPCARCAPSLLSHASWHSAAERRMAHVV